MPYIGQFIPFGAWTMVNYDMKDYDEHGVWLLAQDAMTGPSYFIVTETGYYQVNARVDFELSEVPIEGGELININNPNYPGYVSIAIFVSTDQGQSWFMYAQGNKMQGADNNSSGWNDLRNNLG